MDQKENVDAALEDLLLAVERWREAVGDYWLSGCMLRYRAALDTAETVLVTAHDEHWAACNPREPEPEYPFCAQCEADWNEHYKDEIAASKAADVFMQETLPRICNPRH